ncbi:MAG: hypothetical protein HQL56_01330 [Magnetococcales bacterium]|nr:hypothetical protein [Magnetococcales bacterium]
MVGLEGDFPANKGLPWRGPRLLVTALALLGLQGCFEEPTKRRVEVAVGQESGNEPTEGIPRLPLAPHAERFQAVPTPDMAARNKGAKLRFLVLDKRTLQVNTIEIGISQEVAAPWGGTLEATAFEPSLLIGDGMALRGREGHVNPAVWVIMRDQTGEMLHEGWLFSRDVSQTAWDHPRFDISFIGEALRTGEVPTRTAPGKPEGPPPSEDGDELLPGSSREERAESATEVREGNVVLPRVGVTVETLDEKSPPPGKAKR